MTRSVAPSLTALDLSVMANQLGRALAYASAGKPLKADAAARTLIMMLRVAGVLTEDAP